MMGVILVILLILGIIWITSDTYEYKGEEDVKD